MSEFIKPTPTCAIVKLPYRRNRTQRQKKNTPLQKGPMFKIHFFTIMTFSPCLSLKYLLNCPEIFTDNLSKFYKAHQNIITKKKTKPLKIALSCDVLRKLILSKMITIYRPNVLNINTLSKENILITLQHVFTFINFLLK